MILKELTGYKSSKQPILDTLLDLIERGKIDVKAGGFAVVLMPKGKPYVYRVWCNDRGYERYLEYVEKHEGNEHLVRPLSKARSVAVDFLGSRMKSVTLVKLEKLKDIKLADYERLEPLLDYLRDGGSTDGIEEKALLDTVLELRKHIVGHQRVYEDMHAGNFMMRGDTIVVNDPFASYEAEGIIEYANLYDFNASWQ